MAAETTRLRQELLAAKTHTEAMILEHLRAFQDLTGFCPCSLEVVTTPSLGGASNLLKVELRIEV